MISTSSFAFTPLDLTRKSEFTYREISKLEVAMKNDKEFTIYLNQGKKILTFSSNSRGHLLGDLNFFIII